jgi:hypothetical protein
MPEVEEIQEFEQKVVKTFCDLYLRKGLGCIVKIDFDELEEVDSIDAFIKYLLKRDTSTRFLIFESWIENTFYGFQNAIKKSLILFPPKNRSHYSESEIFKQKLLYLYEVFFNLHDIFVQRNKSSEEIDAITGDDSDFFFENANSYDIQSFNQSISSVQYEKKLAMIYEELTGNIIQPNTVSNKKINISPEKIKILRDYFNTTQCAGKIRYLNESDLMIGCNKVKYKNVDIILKKIADGKTGHSNSIRCYAKYIFLRGNLSIKQVAIEFNLSPNSLKDAVKTKLLEAIYTDISKYIEE